MHAFITAGRIIIEAVCRTVADIILNVTGISIILISVFGELVKAPEVFRAQSHAFVHDRT